MNIKSILSAVIALLAAYGLIKIIWWLISAVFSVAVDLLQIVVLVLLAIPLYIVVRQKFLK